MIDVISVCMKTLTKIGELLCSHLLLKMEEIKQHVQHIMLYYFKTDKNATEGGTKMAA